MGVSFTVYTITDVASVLFEFQGLRCCVSSPTFAIFIKSINSKVNLLLNKLNHY